MPARVPVGRVVGAHGLRGELRVRYQGDGPESLLAAREVALGTNPEDEEARVLEVTSASPGRRGEVRLGLAGVADRDSADALRGQWLLMDLAHLPRLPQGEFYWYQLIGCRVVGHDGTEVGTVREILETGAHDVLVVEGGDGREHLLPTARELLTEVDLEGRRLVMELLPGLLDAEV